MRRPLLPSHLANTDPGNAPLPPPPFASLSRISQHQASSTSHVSRTNSPSRPPELGQCHRTSKIILAEFGIWWGIGLMLLRLIVPMAVSSSASALN